MIISLPAMAGVTLGTSAINVEETNHDAALADASADDLSALEDRTGDSEAITDEAASAAGSNDPRLDAEDVEIDSALEETTGETVEVVVRLDAQLTSTATAGDSSVTDLQSAAEQSQSDLVGFAEDTDSVEVLNQFWIANAVLLEVDTDKVDLETIAAQNGVERLHANFEVDTPQPESFEASDSTETTYGLEQINAPDVWDEYETHGEGIRVAVLDTGVDIDHPDLDLYTENQHDPTYPGGWAEIDFSGEQIADSQPHDTHYHGTHVSGTVAGGNASDTAIGVAPEVDLMHGLVLPGGSGQFTQLVGGVEWAVEEDAHVISMSLGVDGHHADLLEPVRNAEDAGTIVVSSSGNTGEGTSGHPANLYDSFAVGASNEAHDVPLFSSGEVVDTEEIYGSTAPDDWPDEYVVPDVVAPGESVLSAIPEGSIDESPDATYGYLDGTSMAAPHVAGTIALMQSVTGGQTSIDELESAIESTTWKPDDAPTEQDIRYGHGIVDALTATDTVAVDSGINGTVTAPDGTPIEGATVSIGRFSTETDSNGFYEFTVGASEHTLDVEQFGFANDSATVDVGEDEVVVQDFELGYATDARLVEDQPFAVEDGGEFDVTFEVANLEEYSVQVGEGYDTDDLTFELEGEEFDATESVEFDEPITDTIILSVGTASNTSGDVTLEHAFTGFNETVTIGTGPTGVFDETIDVGVVDRSVSSLGTVLASELQATAPWFNVDEVHTDELDGAVAADDYDVYVVQHFGDADVEAFVDATHSADVGVILLDQFADDSNAITAYSGVTGNPTSVNNATGTTFQPDVAYGIVEEHEIFDGVGEAGDTVGLYTSPAVLLESSYHATMAGFNQGDYGSKAIATTRITGPFGASNTGTGIAVDQFSRTVWAPSLGHGQYAAVGDDFEDEAYQILTNSVEYAAQGELAVTPTSPQDERVDPGEGTTVTVEGDAIEQITVDLVTDDSSLSEDNLSLYIDGSINAFGEWRGFSQPVDGEVEVTVVPDDDTVGTFSLEHTVRTDEEEDVEILTGPTSVYEPPLEVPEDTNSIQDALNVSVDGEEIIVDDGTYYEDAPHNPARTSRFQRGVALWIGNDGITLRAAEDAEPTVLWDAWDWADTAPAHILVTGDDVHVDGLTVNVEDGETDVDAGYAVRPWSHQGTLPSNLTVTDSRLGGHGGVHIEDDLTGVTIDNVTAVDTNGLARTSPVTVNEVDEPTLEDAGITASNLEELGLGEFGLEGMPLADLGIEELADEETDLGDADLDEVQVNESHFEDLDPAILPDPEPETYTGDIRISNSSTANERDSGAHGIILGGVENVTIEDSDIHAPRRAIFFQDDTPRDVGSKNVIIENVTASGDESGMTFRESSVEVRNSTITGGEIGVNIDRESDRAHRHVEIADSTISGNSTGISVASEVSLHAEGNVIEDAETGVRFYQRVSVADPVNPDNLTVRYNDLANTTLPFQIDAWDDSDDPTVDGEPVDTRLNYVGEASPVAEENIMYSPYLTETPTDEMPDPEEVTTIGVDLEFEAGNTYAVGVPGPTPQSIDEMFTDDFEGVVYGFDADTQSWDQLQSNAAISALDALMVVADSDGVAHLEFTTEDGAPPAPGQTTLDAGWNFVASPTYGGADGAFEHATTDVSLVMHTTDRPVGQIAPAGDLEGLYTGSGDEPRVSPFEGYFVFVDDEGVLPAHLPAEPTMSQLYDQLAVAAPRGTGADAEEPTPSGIDDQQSTTGDLAVAS